MQDVTDVGALVRDVYTASSRIDAGEQTMSYARNGDVRDQNKRVDALLKLLDELAGSPEGRVALESLLHDPSPPTLRIWTANTVMRWDGLAARDALEQVVSSSGGEVVRPMTMTVALQAPWGPARNAALSLLNLATA